MHKFHAIRPKGRLIAIEKMPTARIATPGSISRTATRSRFLSRLWRQWNHIHKRNKHITHTRTIHTHTHTIHTHKTHSGHTRTHAHTRHARTRYASRAIHASRATQHTPNTPHATRHAAHAIRHTPTQHRPHATRHTPHTRHTRALLPAVARVQMPAAAFHCPPAKCLAANIHARGEWIPRLFFSAPTAREGRLGRNANTGR
jgi:hypothetical protein